jgi:NAD+ kinase
MGRNVLLLYNPDKPRVLDALAEVRALVNRHGRVVAEHTATNEALSVEQAAGAELVVVLGGDGTLMTQTRRCAGFGLPLLGVNLGKLGFMAEFDLESLRVQAKSLFDGSPMMVQDRPMLRVSATEADGSTLLAGAGDRLEHKTLALNDCVITAGPPFRMISVNIRIDGARGPSILGDGLVVSTPIGSTAYNASLGGPIVAPDVFGMILTPIAAQSLSFRPVVVSASSTIEIEIERANDEAAGTIGTSLVLDGQVAGPLGTGSRVMIRQHARAVRFVRNPMTSYWGTLIHKMRWAAPPNGHVG